MRTTRYAAAIPLVSLLYFAPNLWRGGVVLPLDILHHLGPFGATKPPELERLANPHLSDLVTMIYPWMELFRFGDELVPLWNPYSFCGSPLVASAQTGLLFPLSWIYKLAPIGMATLVVAAGKLVLCGFGAFLYLRALALHPAAALFGALVTMLSGQLIVWLGYPASFALASMPLVFWALERYAASPDLRRIAALGASYGLVFLGSQPQFGFVIALASVVYFAVRIGRGEGRSLRLYGGFCAAAALGFCLAAPQILPFLEYLRESAAGRLRAGFGWKLYPWFTLASWMVPRFFGDPRDDNFWGFSSLLGEAVSVGTVPLLLAAVGTAARRHERSGRALVAVLAFGFLGLYLPPTQRLYRALPLLGSIDNNKLLVLIGFALAALAAFGFDAIVRGRRKDALPVWLASAAAWSVLVAAVTLVFRDAIGELGLGRFEARELAWHAGFLLAATAALWGWARGRVGPAPASAILALLTAVDLFRIWVGYYPSFPAAYLRPRSESVEFLRRSCGDARFIGLDGFLPPETSILYRLRDARGIEGLTPWRHYQLFGRIDSTMHDLATHLPVAPPAAGRWDTSTLFHRSLARQLEGSDPATIAALHRLDYWNSEIARIERPGLLSVLGVRYILAPTGETLPASAGFRRVHASDAEVWENPRPLPRAFISTKPVFVSTDDAALEAVSDPAFPFETAAVVRAQAAPAPESTAARIVPARIVRERADAVEIRAESGEGGWLVLSDLFYPGWQATVDGAPVEIVESNYIFRAVRLEPGRHTVRFVYRPGSFYGGVALALAAALLMCLGTVVPRRFPPP